MNRHIREWDIFISYASEDREEVARSLARWLEHHYGLRVWFDEFELRVGDSIRRSIDQGLAKSRLGIVIISKAFFAKHWPQEELAALATKEVAGKKVILPIWHGITAAEVSEHSPILADKVALHWSHQPHAMINALVQAMGLPFHGTELAGVWVGETGRLRLQYNRNSYTFYEQFYDGNYDWKGVLWSGRLSGAYSRASRVFLFIWSWSEGPERGIGFFDYNPIQETLSGGWAISSSDIRLDGVERWDLDVSHRSRVLDPRTAVENLRKKSHVWSFAKPPADIVTS